MNRWILALVLLLLSACASVPDDGFTLRASACLIEINPPIGAPMGGYFSDNRRVKDIRDDLFARCLMLEFPNGRRLVIVTLDLVGFLNYDALAVRERIQSDRALRDKIDPDSVIICSTHTHSSSDTIGIFGPGRDELYIDSVRKKIIVLLKAGLRALEPAKLKHAVADGRGISKNWKVPAEIDWNINVLAVNGRLGRIGTLINFACHPEALGKKNRSVTADFPGFLCRRIEQRFGGIALYANGALGGMVSIDTAHLKNQEKGFEMAEEVATVLESRIVEENFEDFSANDVVIRKRRITLPINNVLIKTALATERIPSSEDTLAGDNVVTEIGIVHFGDLAIILIPGEIVPRLGLKLKQALARFLGTKPNRVLLIGLANDEIGYILPSQDFDLPIYKQERTKSLGPETGDRLMAEFEKIMTLHR